MTVRAGAGVLPLRGSVVMPALNESRNLPHVFARVPPDLHEVIVVDGLSCYGSHYTDLCYGYNAFWRRLVPLLGLDAVSPAPPNGGRLWGDGFEVETLIHLRVAAAGLAVTEVSSLEHSRIHGVSNLSAASDGFRVLRTILAKLHRSRWSRRRGHAPAAEALPPEEAQPAVGTKPQPSSLTAERSGDRWGQDLATRAVE